ncbi:10099_t:CDS:2 [Gigaspora rosea]|nr:10099_t:CDS:2 [Gigaspora rosea]
MKWRPNSYTNENLNTTAPNVKRQPNNYTTTKRIYHQTIKPTNDYLGRATNAILLTNDAIPKMMTPASVKQEKKLVVK